MKKIVKKFSKMVLLATLISVIIIGNESQAAVYGGSYSFSLQAGGTGAPGVSSSVTKQTNNGYAKLFVKSYTIVGSNQRYYTRAFVRGYYNSWDQPVSSTYSYNIYYTNSGPFFTGNSHTLYMLTASDNPYQTKVSGTWTP